VSPARGPRLLALAASLDAEEQPPAMLRQIREQQAFRREQPLRIALVEQLQPTEREAQLWSQQAESAGAQAEQLPVSRPQPEAAPNAPGARLLLSAG
jgi:hypothetical protein